MGRIAHPALQELYHLDASALSFHDQLDNILHSQRYELCVPNLGDSDLMGLVDYLDEVRCRVTFSPLPLSQHRLSTVSILLVAPPGSVLVNSEACVALTQYSRRPPRFPLIFYPLTPTRSPRRALVICTAGSIMVQWFASNACGCSTKMIYRWLPRFKTIPVTSHVHLR